MSNQNKLREQLKELKSKGITYSFVAKELNITKASLSCFLKEKNNLKEENIEKLEEVLERYKSLLSK